MSALETAVVTAATRKLMTGETPAEVASFLTAAVAEMDDYWSPRAMQARLDRAAAWTGPNEAWARARANLRLVGSDAPAAQ